MPLPRIFFFKFLLSGIESSRWNDTSANYKARSQAGEGESNSPSTYLVLFTRNLKNFKDKYAGQPTNKRATTYSIHALPLLNHRGWKRLIFKKLCICKTFCIIL